MYYTNSTLTSVQEAVTIGHQLPFLLFQLQFESRLRNVCSRKKMKVCSFLIPELKNKDNINSIKLYSFHLVL